MAQGYLSYPQMLQVFNLVLFSLTFGSAMLDFSELFETLVVAEADGQYQHWPNRKLLHETLSDYTFFPT